MGRARPLWPVEVPMRKTTRFRELINAPEILMLPVAHDALAALAIVQAGFSALSVAGYGTAKAEKPA